jgi:hypothetical protein
VKSVCGAPIVEETVSLGALVAISDCLSDKLVTSPTRSELSCVRDGGGVCPSPYNASDDVTVQAPRL